MQKIILVADAARELKISEVRVRQLIRELAVGQRIGARLYVLSRDDLKILRSRETQRGRKKVKASL